MCRLVHHLNFMGKYVIFDLPEFSLLQYYFLKSYGFAVYKNLDEFDRNPYGILCCSSQEIFARLATFDLFIGTWSISESPVALRDEIFSRGAFENYLIAFQDTYSVP
ncbi:MAG: hypothetical protein HYR55_01365 [Acidobacteria bacterium]|nr:hypothetical protein [Acidobacteriota bacterium]